MLCQHCKKNQATIHFVENINGFSVELALCEACYAHKYGEFETITAQAFMNGLFSSPNKPKNKTCPVCRMTLSDYQKTGLVGCASCYDVFKDQILPSISNVQGDTVHTGKNPAISPEHDMRIKLREMQDSFKKAFQQGDYKEASRLNALMSEIKKGMGGKNE